MTSSLCPPLALAERHPLPRLRRMPKTSVRSREPHPRLSRRPVARCVVSRVLAPAQELKVLRMVVLAVPVPMVNTLGTQEWPTEFRGHDETVLVDPPVVVGVRVAVRRDKPIPADALVSHRPKLALAEDAA